MNQASGIPGSTLLVLRLVAALYGAVFALAFAAMADPQDLVRGEQSFRRFSLLVPAFAVLQVLALPIWGALSDRISPRGILMISTSLVLLGALFPLVPMPWPRTMISRIILGAGAAGFVLSLSFCANLVESNRRSPLVAPLFSAFLLGGLLMMVCKWLCLREGMSFGGAMNAASALILVMAILSMLGIKLRLEEAWPKSEIYRGTNAMAHLWHGFSVLWSGTGFALIALIALSGFAAAQGLLWVAPAALRGSGAPGMTSGPALVMFGLPWIAAAVAAALFFRFVPKPQEGKSAAALLAGVLLVVLALASAFWNPGWIPRTALACGIGFCATVLACLALAAVMASTRSRELGAATGAAFALWLAAFAVSKLLVLLASGSGELQGLGYLLVASSVLALCALWFVLRSSVLKPIVARKA